MELPAWNAADDETEDDVTNILTGLNDTEITQESSRDKGETVTAGDEKRFVFPVAADYDEESEDETSSATLDGTIDAIMQTIRKGNIAVEYRIAK